MGQQESTAAGGAAAPVGEAPYPQPGLMKSWVMRGGGDLNSIILIDSVGIPQPAPGQVRVTVMAAGLGHSDVRRVRGSGMAFPAAVGIDGAGVVDAVGPGCPEHLTVGKRVYFMCDAKKPYGSLAEHTLVDVNRVFEIADGVDFATAASLPTSCWAAHYALFSKLRVQKERTIYVTGGAGGVGGFAVDLARKAGLTVITSCSSYNIEYAKERGAQYVLDYTSDDIKKEIAQIVGGAGVDYILDTVSSQEDELAELFALLSVSGELCSLTGTPPPRSFDPAGNQTLHYVNVQTVFSNPHAARTAQTLADTVASVAATGGLAKHVGEVGDFHRALGALKTLETRHARGKLVIDVAAVHTRRKKLERAKGLPSGQAETDAEAEAAKAQDAHAAAAAAQPEVATPVEAKPAAPAEAPAAPQAPAQPEPMPPAPPAPAAPQGTPVAAAVEPAPVAAPQPVEVQAPVQAAPQSVPAPATQQPALVQPPAQAPPQPVPVEAVPPPVPALAAQPAPAQPPAQAAAAPQPQPVGEAPQQPQIQKRGKKGGYYVPPAYLKHVEERKLEEQKLQAARRYS